MIERYYLETMKKIWGEENYYRKYKEVEMAVLKARGENKLSAKVNKIRIKPEDVRKREKICGHEINAFIQLLEEKLGKEAGRIHKGLTSSDIMDTARVLQIKESLEIIEKKLIYQIKLLKAKTKKYKNLIMCGRTHGQVAEPITLGLKFARFLEGARRNLERLREARKRILTAKISGAVGTYSLIFPAEEKKILKVLGLKPLKVSSQIVPRDLFAEYIFLLSLIVSLPEEIALEIRLLSQDGIKEITEPFTSRQTGSSVMPHKKNPVICERICGLARLVRSFTGVALSNIALWNERDISHSSNERVILEEATVLCFYILEKLEFVLKNLVVHPQNIKRNLEAAGLRLYSSGILKALLDKGYGRKHAYSMVQNLFKRDIPLREVKRILKVEGGLMEEEIEKILELRYFLRHINKIYRRLEV